MLVWLRIPSPGRATDASAARPAWLEDVFPGRSAKRPEDDRRTTLRGPAGNERMGRC